MTKLLVATGSGFKSVEVINLDENTPNLVCDNLPDLHLELRGLTGQLYQGSKPILCGGCNASISNQCDCYIYENKSWNKFESLVECVRFPSSVSFSLPNGSDIFLIAGGYDGNTSKATVQSYNGSSWNIDNNAVLPFPTWVHCLVKINDSVLLLIGGYDISYQADSFFFHIKERRWTPGPALNIARYGHGCGTIDWLNTSSNQVEKVVFAVGGKTFNDTYLNVVEMLYLNEQNIDNLKWIIGPQLPKTASFGTVVEFQNSIILVGGTGQVDGKHLYQLTSPNGTWTEMKQTLKERRYYHASFLVPDELVNCY
jgi:hypothetical protein